ncbi:MAG: DUF2202 domain-containing protein [Dehalococcoidia bacterium]|nr:DUF2202 domain-containing protein [Dehalococcoidia bacterium]
MKTIGMLAGMTALVALPMLLAGCAGADTETPDTVQEEGATAETHALAPVTDENPLAQLTETEIEGILFMREEEKLARDVYLQLADMWSTNTFANISQSEQTHMDEVLLLIDKYGLTDPVEGNENGVFEDAKLQQLYDDLVAQGSVSEIEALKVGAAIEEIDIFDLEEYLAQTDNADIQQVYGDLLTGSMKHLSSFTSVLEKRGVTYEPQYLDSAAYETILSSEFARGGK